MTQENDMGTVLVSHFSETHGDRYKRTVPLNSLKS